MRRKPKKPKNPCKNCIILPICLSKYQQLKDSSVNYQAISFLSRDCKLLEQYLKRHTLVNTIKIPDPLIKGSYYKMTPERREIIRAIIMHMQCDYSSSSPSVGTSGTSSS